MSPSASRARLDPIYRRLCATASGILALLLATTLVVEAQQPVPATPPGAQGDFAGLVDIGGRRLYLECQGSGSPTVVLEAGYGNRADVWSIDQAPPSTGRRHMVFPAVAGFTRVCAYDRPGTTGPPSPEADSA